MAGLAGSPGTFEQRIHSLQGHSLSLSLSPPYNQSPNCVDPTLKCPSIHLLLCTLFATASSCTCPVDLGTGYLAESGASPEPVVLPHSNPEGFSKTQRYHAPPQL